MKIGEVFGRLVVTALIPDRKNPKARCECSCGAISFPQRGSLRSGKTRSCGCLGRELQIAAVVRHGKYKTPEYSVFRGMIDRCNNPRNTHYKNYGGRGIRVRYVDFHAFLSDVGERPKGAWIDRIYNDGDYEVGNCKWTTPSENLSNTRVSKVWRINGVEYKNSSIAAKFLGLDPSTVNRRCNGHTNRHGNFIPPIDGWSCNLKDESSNVSDN